MSETHLTKGVAGSLVDLLDGAKIRQGNDVFLFKANAAFAAVRSCNAGSSALALGLHQALVLIELFKSHVVIVDPQEFNAFSANTLNHLTNRLKVG